MDKWENATVVKKANIYFDGKVTSRTVFLADGSRKTLGIMLPGEYEFSTSTAEEMEILGGEMAVLFPNAADWRTFTAGDRFDIAANVHFQLQVRAVTDYCCSYE
jgi:hypothetical protein